MLTYFRYALATICFALSVACLGLWWRSTWTSDQFLGPNCLDDQQVIYLELDRGNVFVEVLNLSSQLFPSFERYENQPLRIPAFTKKGLGAFELLGNAVFFPLWYPTLVFGLAGIGALRLGRRFTLRSAIIATTVVAGLLGMVIAL